MDVYANEYMIDGTQMGIVGKKLNTLWYYSLPYLHYAVSDSDQNLIIYQYQPEGM